MDFVVYLLSIGERQEALATMQVTSTGSTQGSIQQGTISGFTHGDIFSNLVGLQPFVFYEN